MTVGRNKLIKKRKEGVDENWQWIGVSLLLTFILTSPRPHQALTPHIFSLSTTASMMVELAFDLSKFSTPRRLFPT